MKLWQAALRTRISPNGVFGLKGFPVQFEALVQSNPALLGQARLTDEWQPIH